MTKIARLRLASQRLTDSKFDNPTDVVRWFGGVQAQDFPFAKWGIGLRMNDPSDATVTDAFNRGEILRTHALRPTWHFLARDDFRWIMELTGRRVHQSNAALYRRLEVDDVVYRKARKLIMNALKDGNYLTRTELAAVLGTKGLVCAGQRMAYIAMRAELDAIICSGPLKGNKQTYALVDERVPTMAKLSFDEALTELARRYFTSHGPATLHDFAWWSGMTIAHGRRATEMLGADVASVHFDDKTYWMTAGLEPARFRSPVAHLLPNYDEHIVAYRDHQPSLDPGAPDALKGWGNGSTTHVVIRDGIAIGGWKRTADGDAPVARMYIRMPINDAERRAVGRAAAAYADFLGLPISVKW
jgi:hypothetical protein